MTATPLKIFALEWDPEGWCYRHVRNGSGPARVFDSPDEALCEATSVEHVVVARLVRTLRARRAGAAREARDAAWLGCAKTGAEVRWLPARDGAEKREEGWYLVTELEESFVEVGIDWCPWCGSQLDHVAGARGQNAFEIVSRQPLRGFLLPEERADWPAGNFRPDGEP